MFCLSMFFAGTGPSSAQDPNRPDQTQETKQPSPEGKVVGDLRIEPPTVESVGAIQASLKTLVGRPFRGSDADDDIVMLWRDFKILCRVEWEPMDNDEIRVVFVVWRQFKRYDRVAFQGQSALTETELRSLLKFGVAQSVNDVVAESHARIIEERYRRDGYYWAKVTIVKDDERSVLTLQIDEGPKVTVRHVNFRGNESIPGWAPLGLYRNLLGSASLESKPEGALLSGSPFSERNIEDDLEKLRTFYRGLGYRDAVVELVDRRFVDGDRKVDLTFRIIEGRRYRVVSVDIEQLGPKDVEDYQPLYPKEELLKEIKLQPGDFYDRDRVNLDKNALIRFYGKRGHPPRERFGASRLQNALEIGEPAELFDDVNAEIHLTYQIQEGTPKRLRDVVIRGNSQTMDKVIRRKVFLFPGQILDMSLVERSLATLDSLRYFSDPQTYTSVNFDLVAVEGAPDSVDLVIEVQEGATGSFVWGAGLSSGQGVFGRLQFTKRNFDIGRLPSSANPATAIGEIIRGTAFHGAGQELDIMLAPGTQISTGRISFYEPDIFGTHFDTVGLRVQGMRTIRLLDGYRTDESSAYLGLQRNFTENFSIHGGINQSTVKVDRMLGDAPSIVFDARGQTELRGIRLGARLRDLDQPTRPNEGYDLELTLDVMGGPFGAEKDLYKVGLSGDYYWPFYRDSLERPHVLHARAQFNFGDGYGRDSDLFLTERYYMGGGNLRGFDHRGAGPSQFNRPIGGRVRGLASLEYIFPLVSTRLENRFRETEILRGRVFTDLGVLGLDFDDPGLRDLRGSIGFGLLIFVPYLDFPIALDLATAFAHQESDDRRPFYFSIGR